MSSSRSARWGIDFPGNFASEQGIGHACERLRSEFQSSVRQTNGDYLAHVDPAETISRSEMTALRIPPECGTPNGKTPIASQGCTSGPRSIAYSAGWSIRLGAPVSPVTSIRNFGGVL